MNKIKILVVCFANYCRSPVAEIMLQQMLGKTYSVSSAGLHPLSKVSIDPRSKDYLVKNGYNLKIHNPTKVNKKIIIENDMIFALDLSILVALKKKYKANNIKAFNYFDTSVDLTDPYNIKSEHNYFKIMNNIETCASYLSKKIKSNEI